MEATVDHLSAAYDDFMAAAAAVVEARAQSGGEKKTAATDAALEAFKQRWELFRVACDHAEELVESIRQRIGSECLVDEATGSASAGSVAAPGIRPISAVRLEQMSKAVRWLVIELQHGASAQGAGGSGGAATPNAGAGGQHPEEGGQ
ncbi:mediator of RNA polymerase II transcription subunit 32-like [Miscanthus floridulus]|uniref:mediator of RNA polymerase II transcription subunit 32-like n=1 Tax=Miscanthus floridulus TaxID=154761 RepID=UPI0034587EEF